MRIIYKIKSSWDFIFSQILNYLKRRWNSKMAISIKNHEDRITALENKTVKQEWIKLSSDFKLTTSPQQLFKIPSVHGIAMMWWNYAKNTDFKENKCSFIPVGHHTTWMAGYVSSQEHVYIELSNTKNPGYSTCTVWEEGSSGLGDNYVLSAWLLKLYYNFSYNITREFYFVKFKLKHYLCSHLQKFI